MSQAPTTLANQSGALFRAALNAALAAIESNHVGDNAPANPQAGWIWVDTNTPSPSQWTANFYTGSNWLPFFFIDLLTGGLRPANAMPPGSGCDFWGAVAPPGFIFPFGQAISRATYSVLFGVLGTTYGTGDGSTTFNLPDKSGRVSYPRDNMSGTPRGRITSSVGGINATLLGAAGGVNQHQHHFITQNVAMGAPTSTVPVVAQSGGTAAGDLNHSHNTQVIGDTDMNVNALPPGIVCNYIIATGGP